MKLKFNILDCLKKIVIIEKLFIYISGFFVIERVYFLSGDILVLFYFCLRVYF